MRFRELLMLGLDEMEGKMLTKYDKKFESEAAFVDKIEKYKYSRPLLEMWLLRRICG